MKKLFCVPIFAAALMAAAPALYAAEPAKEPVKDVKAAQEVVKAAKEELEAAKQELKKAKGAAKKKAEEVEKTGIIEVKPAEKGEKFDTISIKVGAETFKLLPGKGAKKLMDELKALAGKEVTVSGKMIEPNEKHPLPAIKIKSYTVAGAAPAAAAPAAAPADAKPAAEPAPAEPAPAGK